MWRNPRRTILTLGAVALGAWGSLGISSVARGVSYGMAKDAISKLTGHIQIHADGYLSDPSVEHSMELTEKARKTLSTHPRIKAWSERVRVPAVVMSERESAGVTVVGIDPKAELPLSFIGTAVKSGAMLSATDDPGIVLGRKMLELLSTDVGKRVVVLGQDINNEIAERGFRIVGVFDAELESTEKSFVFIGLKTAQKMFGFDLKISEVTILTDDYEKLDAVVKELKHELLPLKVSPWQELEPLIVALLKVQGGFIVLWFFIVVITISFGLVNTLFMAIFERTREIGLIMSLGLKPRMVILLILTESLLLLLLGAALGNMLTLSCIYLLSDGIDISRFSGGAEYFGARSVIIPQIVPSDWLKGNLMILGLGLLSAFYPAWKASRTVPMEALRAN